MVNGGDVATWGLGSPHPEVAGREERRAGAEGARCQRLGVAAESGWTSGRWRRSRTARAQPACR
jgi:hypothetical protein